MSRQKINKTRRIRPPKLDDYSCSHCRSATRLDKEEATGLHRLHIFHDRSCPVLAGTLSDIPDTLRMAKRTGGFVVMDPKTGAHVVAYEGDGS